MADGSHPITMSTPSPFARAAIINRKRCERWSVDDASLDRPLRWRNPRQIWLVRDLFHENLPDEWIDRVFAIMALAPQHIFLVLTKRAERMRDYMRSASERIGDAAFVIVKGRFGQTAADTWNNNHGEEWPLPNVWLGVSCEDQARADERIPLLLETPAAVRFISAEPLLGPIDIRRWLDPTGIRCPDVDPDTRYLLPEEISYVATKDGGEVRPLCPRCGQLASATGYDPGLDWVITGGESGPHARGALREWYRSIRDQCQAAGVAYFHQQNGEWIDADEWLDIIERGPAQMLLDGDPWHPAKPLNYTDAMRLAAFSGRDIFEHQSDGSTLIRVGKRAAGRLLDGRSWDQFP